MKRFVPIAVFLLALGYLAGRATSPGATVAAQGRGGEQQGPPAPKLETGKAFVVSMDDIKAKFPPADKTGKVAPSSISTNLGWNPAYSLVVMRRPYFDPPQKSNNTGNMVRWNDAEMHEQKSQLYIIVSGTGQVALGGKPPKEREPIRDGQHGGEPLGPAQGATMQKLKAGDIVVIPTYAWHQPQADPGQTLTYIKVDIKDPHLIP